MDETRTLPLTMIIPAHNRQAELETALRSIVDQKIAIGEIIVVDDGSSPPLTLPTDVVELKNVRLIRRPLNGGAAAARNTGILVAKTPWISFLDSDDLLLPGTLQLRWQKVEADQASSPDTKKIYGCGWLDFSENDGPLQTRIPFPSDSSRDFAAGCWFSPGSCIIINRAAALGSVGAQDEKLRRLEDYDWFLALALAGFRLQTDPIIGVRIRRERRQDPKTITDCAQMIRKKWNGRLPDPSFHRQMEAYLSLEASAVHYFAGNRSVAAFWFARSLFFVPRWRLQCGPGWQISGKRSISGLIS